MRTNTINRDQDTTVETFVERLNRSQKAVAERFPELEALRANAERDYWRAAREVEQLDAQRLLDYFSGLPARPELEAELAAAGEVQRLASQRHEVLRAALAGLAG